MKTNAPFGFGTSSIDSSVTECGLNTGVQRVSF